MDEARFDQSLKSLAGFAGRRDAVRSLATAGAALLATLGLTTSGEAKKHKHGGGKNKNDKNRNQAERRGGGGGNGGGGGGKGKPGPTGPTGPTGPAGGGTGAGGTGPTGPTGPAGPRGQSGAAGAQGPAGPAGSSTTRVKNSGQVIGSNGAARAFANCDPGWHVVGGGIASSDLNNIAFRHVISQPMPDDNNGVARSWFAEVANASGTGSPVLRAFAICVPD